MKKFSFLILTCLLFTFDIYSRGMVPKNREKVYNTSLLIRSDEELEQEWYSKRIPKEYCDAFLYYTKDKKDLRIKFYSIMVHESGNFRRYVNKNKNGTYDYGPSQLNSANIKSELFRKKYNPTDESHITNKYCFYMVMTINLYDDLLERYGYDYAFLAYNGGERTIGYKKKGLYKDSSLMKHVTNYDKCVKALVEKNQKELDEYKREKRFKIVKQILDNERYIVKDTNNIKAAGSKNRQPQLFNVRFRKRRYYKLYKLAKPGYYYVRFA